MIGRQTATVWFSPTSRRRFLTRRGAIRAEAAAIILARHPVEHGSERDGDPGWDIRWAEPERFENMQRRLCRLINQAAQRGREE